MTDPHISEGLENKPSPAVSGSLMRQISASVVFLTAIRTYFASVPLGLMVGLATAPMWISSLRRYRGALTLAIAVLVAVAWGIALTAQQEPFNGGTSYGALLANSLLPVFILTGTGALLWGREHLSDRTIGISIGLGLLMTNILNGSITSSENPWKFGVALPLSVILLSISTGFRRWQWTLAVLLLLGALNAGLDSRSAFATCILAALLYVAQRQWSKRSRGSIWARALSLLLVGIAAATVLYQVASHLLMAGYLGGDAQQRSIMQDELAGSMIVGGRPEMAATWALMQSRPAGFGAGAIPSNQDLMVAKSGMWEINYQPDNGYVENYMFGGGIKLHSVVGDMWAYYGFAGVALAVLISVLLVHALFIRLAMGTASGLVIFLICTALWNIPFGPLWSSTPILAVTIGLALIHKGRARSARELIAERIGKPERSTSTLHLRPH